MSDFIKYSPKRSPKAMTNAKWTASDEYRKNYDESMREEAIRVHTYSQGCKRPFCTGCDKAIIDGKMCSCGSTCWVYR